MAIIAAIVRIGLDIAKPVFQVHGVDAHDKPRLRNQIKRAMVLELFAQLPPCEVGIEACGGALWPVAQCGCWGRIRRATKLWCDAHLSRPAAHVRPTCPPGCSMERRVAG
jgi:hypothetical protein